jgi:hypothetical protein
MLASSRYPFQLSPPASRAARVLRVVTRVAPVVLAVAAMAVAIVPADGTARTVTGDGPPPAASPVFSPAEAALLAAALRSPDARTRWSAVEVAAGRAGFVALSDGALLRHHGILSADPNRVTSQGIPTCPRGCRTP